MKSAIQCPGRVIQIDNAECLGARIDDQLAVSIEDDCLAITVSNDAGTQHARIPWDQVLYRMLVSSARRLWIDSTYQQRVDFLNQIGATFVAQAADGPAYMVNPCANPRI